MIFYVLASSAQPATSKATLSLELFLSILAIVISVSCAIFEYFWNQKINKTNLEADFFKEIYGDYLMTKIPKARQYIHYNDGNVSDTDDLIEVINNMRHSSLFYKYKDNEYYKLLCKQLQHLEDILVSKTGSLSDDDYVEFVQEVNADIESIYKIIMKKYIGKKI